MAWHGKSGWYWTHDMWGAKGCHKKNTYQVPVHERQNQDLSPSQESRRSSISFQIACLANGLREVLLLIHFLPIRYCLKWISNENYFYIWIMQRESIVWAISLPLFLLHFDAITIRIQSTSGWTSNRRGRRKSRPGQKGWVCKLRILRHSRNITRRPINQMVVRHRSCRDCLKQFIGSIDWLTGWFFGNPF